MSAFSTFDCDAHLWVVDQQPARKERNVKHLLRKLSQEINAARMLCNCFLIVNEIVIA